MLTYLACVLVLSGPAAWTAREYPFRDATFSVDERGTVALRLGKRTVIRATRLWLAGPDWKSAVTDAGELRQTGAHQGGTFSLVRLREPVSGGEWDVTIRVGPVAQGLAVSYSAKPLAEMDINELGIVLDLPIEQWSGKPVLLWPSQELTFPETLPTDHHFASNHCVAVVLGSGAERVTVRLDKPGLAKLQDCRKWQGDTYQLTLPLIPGSARVKPGEEYTGGFTLMPKDPQTYRSLAAATLSSRGKLGIRGVRASALEVAQYGKLELAVDLSATYENAFDPEQIDVRAIFQTPSGETREVPAFLWAGFERQKVGESLIMAPTGQGGWRVRFTPTTPGRHSFRVVARDASGQVEWGPGSFEAKASKSHGFVRVSKGRRYFCFDDDTPYFAVGENLCWYSAARRTLDYDLWLPKLRAAGANYIRLWMPSWAFGIEWEKPGVYRLDRAWELDYVLEQCEKLGIYVKLCLENFRRFDEGPNPYDVRNGGPCETVRDFFVKPEARRLFKQRLRYIVARWSYSPALMAWELWNEINCVEGHNSYSAEVIEWSREMASYLREIDPNRHLTVNSLGSSNLDDRLWSLQEMDFAQMHGYYGWSGYDETRDMAAFIPNWLGKISHYGKPYFFAEFGVIREKPECRELCDRDREGVHLHNGMWSAALSGAAGGAMLWWWDSYVEPMNLYPRFASLASFAADVPWHKAGLEPEDLERRPRDLRVLALRGPRLLLFWAQNPRHTWWNVVQGERIDAVTGAEIVVRDLGKGPYRLRLYDTWARRYVRDERVTPQAGTLIIPLGAVTRDAAGKLEPIR